MKIRGLSRGWVLAVGGLAACQAAVLHWGVTQVPAVRPAPLSTVRYSLDTGRDPVRLAGVEGLSSPTLFALPDFNGFSGDAWLKYQPPVPTESTTEEPPTWLAFDTAKLGTTLSAFTASVEPAPSRIVDLPPGWVDNFPVSVVPPARSRLVVEGEIARRLKRPLPPLPGWPAADLIAPTEVQVLINEQGRVLSAILLEGDYSAVVPGVLPAARSVEADRFALEYVRDLAFSSLPLPYPTTATAESGAGGARAGKVTFLWTSLGPSQTNALSSP